MVGIIWRAKHGADVGANITVEPRRAEGCERSLWLWPFFDTTKMLTDVINDSQFRGEGALQSPNSRPLR